MYKMYLDEVLMPVTPSSIKIKITNQNKTITLISGAEVNLLQSPGLSEISFDLLIPQNKYPFAATLNGNAYDYLSFLESLKVNKKTFQWILCRTRPNGEPLFNSNMTVTLEDYTITEDAKDGFDLTVSVKLKQWKPYGTKIITLKKDTRTQETKAAVSAEKRETNNAPNAQTYTVKKGDCLWNIAKKYLGNGSRWKEIYNLNKTKIKNPNLIYPGQVLTLPSK